MCLDLLRELFSDELLFLKHEEVTGGDHNCLDTFRTQLEG
jgi:hypothetical protein